MFNDKGCFSVKVIELYSFYCALKFLDSSNVQNCFVNSILPNFSSVFVYKVDQLLGLKLLNDICTAGGDIDNSDEQIGLFLRFLFHTGYLTQSRYFSDRPGKPYHKCP